MCDAVALGQIQNVVNQKVQANLMFTAFDVTVDVQQLLKNAGQFNLQLHRHSHLKNDVHDAINQHVSSGVYSRSLQDVGAATPAFVYYPVGSNPATYVPQVRKNAVSAPQSSPFTIPIPASVAAAVITIPPLNPSIPQTDSGNDGDGTDTGRKPDGRGTLCVSAFLLRSVGFSPLDTAYVWHEGRPSQNDEFLVVSKQPPSGLQMNSTKYTVDHNCNVRITKAVLSFLGPVGQFFDFTVEPNNTVSVREHK